MHAAAEKAVAEFLKEQTDDGSGFLKDVKCEYLGVAQSDGSYALNSHLCANSDVGFRWIADCDGQQNILVEARANNIIKRGVTFPPSWRIAPLCRDLQKNADDAALKAADMMGLSDVTCRVLGQPLPQQLPDVVDAVVQGGIIELSIGSAGAEFLLCAHVHESMWLCTRGHFIDGSFQVSDPFNEDSLVLKDLQRDGWDETFASQRKRICPHLRRGQLRELAAASRSHWNLLTAIATWRAKLLQAELQGRFFDEGSALSNFERDPFRWHGSGRAIVVCLWTWRVEDEQKEIFQRNRLNNVLERNFTVPNRNNVPDETLWRNLCEAAEHETRHRKAPCTYLGLAVADTFVADPSEWPSNSYPASFGKGRASVHFEWTGTSIEGKPHIVAVSVTHVVHNRRRLPQNPFAATAPSGLRFSVEFMNDVAKNVRGEGICFKGIAYQSESPKIVQQLPQGGIDLQDTPVYWTLPDGRCECWSVRRIAEASEDLLAPQDSEQAYKAVAKEMHYDVHSVVNEGIFSSDGVLHFLKIILTCKPGR